MQYQNEDDNSIREASRMMCALAFIPVEDVLDTLDLFMEQVPDDFLPVAEYFEVQLFYNIILLLIYWNLRKTLLNFKVNLYKRTPS